MKRAHFSLPWLCLLANACLGSAERKETVVRTPASEPSTCEGRSVLLTKERELIGAFESGDISPWHHWNDGTSRAHVSIEPGGAGGSQRAVHFVGGPFLSHGAGFTYRFTCVDVRGQSGVEFWAKAERGRQLAVVLTTPKTLDKEQGGDCTVQCWRKPRAELDLSPEWKRYAIPFGSFKGAKGHLPGIVMGMDFIIAGEFDIWLDEIRFYSGSPSAGAVQPR